MSFPAGMSNKKLIKPMAGKRFGRLRVIDQSDLRYKGQVVWNCRCDCGSIYRVASHLLRSGGVRSCGCLRIDSIKERFATHGHNRNRKPSRTYISWAAMRARCEDPSRDTFRLYGGRGIRVCRRWIKFENFLKDMGQRPVGMTIERKNGDGNYTPSNCKWATQKEQMANSSANKLLTHQGKTVHLAEWARLTGMKRETIAMRLRRGWDIARALSIPVKQLEGIAQSGGINEGSPDWPSPSALAKRDLRGE